MTQGEFAALFGREWKQVSQWERGEQVPRNSTLRRAAKGQGWPLTIFEEGGQRPRDAIKGPIKERGGGEAGRIREGAGGKPYGASAPELLAWAQQAQIAVSQIVRLLEGATESAPAAPAATVGPTLGQIVEGVFPEKLPIPDLPPGRKTGGKGKG